MTMLSIFEDAEQVEQLREKYVRFYVHGQPHGKRLEGRPWGVYDSLDEARGRARQVLADEYSTGGIVTVTECHLYFDTHEGAISHVVQESRR